MSIKIVWYRDADLVLRCGCAAGPLHDHHAFLCGIILRRIDELTEVIEEVTSRIDAELVPFDDAVEHLVTVPGIDRKGAAVIIAETGGDMSRFRTAAHLASWAGVCPGSHESGGVRKSGTRRNGNKALGAALGTAAMGAARTKNSYLRERYYRLAARRGKQRAIVAIEHSLPTAIWHMLVNNIDYHELGPDQSPDASPPTSCAASPNKPTHSASPSASTHSQRPREQAEPRRHH